MSAPTRFLLRAALGFVAALMLANLVAGALGLRWTAAGSHRHLQILHHFLTSEDPPEVVFFGSSMSRHAFPSQVLERTLAEGGVDGAAWNLGLPGASAPIAAPLLEEVLAQRPAPRLLVLEASSFFWNEARPGGGAEMYWRWFAGPADLARGAGRVRAEHAAAAVRGQVWGAEALWRWPQFRFVGENWLHLSDLRESHGGVYSPRVYRALEQGTWPKRLPRPRPVPFDQTLRGFRPLRYAGLWSDTLAEVAAACRARGVDLLLVDLPLRPDLEAALDAEQQAAFRDWIRRRCEEEGVDWIAPAAPGSAPKLRPGGDPPAVFLDPMHLGPEAAAVFAETFARQQLLPRLLG